MANPIKNPSSPFMWTSNYVSPTIRKKISTEGIAKKYYGMARMLPVPPSRPQPPSAPRLKIQEDRRGWAKRHVSQEELQAALIQLQKEEVTKL